MSVTPITCVWSYSVAGCQIPLDDVDSSCIGIAVLPLFSRSMP